MFYVGKSHVIEGQLEMLLCARYNSWFPSRILALYGEHHVPRAPRVHVNICRFLLSINLLKFIAFRCEGKRIDWKGPIWRSWTTIAY